MLGEDKHVDLSMIYSDREKGASSMSEFKDIKDVVIIGGGPAGLSAALYAGRGKLNTVFIEKGFHGGQILTTEMIDNYLGVREITGLDLAMNMYEHAGKFGVEPQLEEVIALKLEGEIKEVVTTAKTYYTKSTILAMGATPKPMGAIQEEKFRGRGISYCAICDGNFFVDKVVAVVGGGDKAVEDALYLERLAKKVYLIHRKGELRAAKILQEQLKQSNVNMIWHNEVKEVYGNERVKGVQIRDRRNGTIKNLSVDGVFVAIGSQPANEMIMDTLPMDKEGYIIAKEDCSTAVPGVFVAGDIRSKEVRQVLTAASDGAIAVYGVEKYISEQGIKK